MSEAVFKNAIQSVLLCDFNNIYNEPKWICQLATDKQEEGSFAKSI